MPMSPFYKSIRDRLGSALLLMPAVAAIIRDESGRVLLTQKGDFAKGYNQFSLDRQLLNTTGLLYYTVETATDKGTKLMIQAR